MNLNLFGHAGKWLIVDCGVTFDDTPTGSEVQMADPLFLSEQKHNICGLVATHAHQDHIGAIPYLWQELQCPIYTTPFTANVLIGKLRQNRCDAPVHIVNEGDRLNIGPFDVSWLPVTHSTPETSALLIQTPAGTILHTADWKIDDTPVIGDGFNLQSWHADSLGAIDAVVCDSTNALVPGRSLSEQDVVDGLLQQIESAPGRVVVACFSSNIARLQTLGCLAENCGRYIGLFGRSQQSMVSSAQTAGYLQTNFNEIAANHLGYLPAEEVLAIVTGSQGEPGSALQRLATDSHPDLTLEAGDRVIFSARTIPGNEQKIAALIALLTDKGIDVVHADHTNTPLHASGHPCAWRPTHLWPPVPVYLCSL
jgi:ribonuclease J